MMIWKNDMGLPFTEIRRACCAAGGKNIRVKENLANKRSKWKQQQYWMLGRRPQAWLPAERPSHRAVHGEEPVAAQRPLGSLALKKGSRQAKMARVGC